MKYFALVLSVLAMGLAACDTRTAAPTASDEPMAKVTQSTEEFLFNVYTDCCGGELVPVTMTLKLLENNNSLHYNWKANETVVGSSGSTYHVVYTDNGFTKWDDIGVTGRIGTLHLRVTRDDGCTFTMVIKLRIIFDGAGNITKEVYDITTECE